MGHCAQVQGMDISMLIVTAAVIVDGGKILLAQRKPGAHMELRWEFPGGKLEEGEHPEQCLIREIKEELDLTIEIIDIYKVVKFKYEENDVLILCYKCRPVGGKARIVDCNAFRWIGRDQLDQFEYVPADVAIVEKLKKDDNIF